MPRFFVNEKPSGAFSLTGEDGRHAAASLRLKAGEPVTLCDGHGCDYDCVCTGVSAGEVQLKVVGTRPSEGEPPCEIALFQCLPKGDKMDEIVQKSVELGATRIVPVLSQRCISRPEGAALKKKTARWNQIAREAAMQSGRGRIPPVDDCVTFDEALRRMAIFPCPVLLYEGEGERKLTALDPRGGCALLVGPEGGIAPAEAAAAHAAGIPAVTLGPRILRTETAGPAAIAIVSFLVGG
ncbi:MAG TPA: 16S rRNA (uracil(1498)-N(3))-methyltransferase [Candidatus Acidoferrum sp.]|nr:16S rRNA (uracil(1498)-N(3))-methyltransferase [Candidatus Acidoferrum sp.]